MENSVIRIPLSILKDFIEYAEKCESEEVHSKVFEVKGLRSSQDFDFYLNKTNKGNNLKIVVHNNEQS